MQRVRRGRGHADDLPRIPAVHTPVADRRRRTFAVPCPIAVPLITLLTDFGTRDAYVGVLKGVIATLAPGVPVVDLTHEIPPQDVMEGGYVLREAYPAFPPGTVHLAVVDPGVGTDRRAVAIESGGHRFVGPDNGLFSLVLGEDPPDAIVTLDRPHAWRTPDISATFHGRDVFAPVAARLAAGAALADVGTPGAPLRVLRWGQPIADADSVRGTVVHIDRYGNAITNVTADDVHSRMDGRAVKTIASGTIVRGLATTYADREPGDPLVLVGSSGYVEIAVRGGNASRLLGIDRGTGVTLVFSS